MLQTGSQSKVSNETLFGSLCKNAQDIGTSCNLSILDRGHFGGAQKSRRLTKGLKSMEILRNS